MTYCERCRYPIETARLRVGMYTCLTCGDLEAFRALRVKRSQVEQGYNKSGLMYLGDSRQAALDAGRKTSAILYDEITPAAPRQSVKSKRRLQIGIWFDANGDRRVWFEGDDPDCMGATRKILFRS